MPKPKDVCTCVYIITIFLSEIGCLSPNEVLEILVAALIKYKPRHHSKDKHLILHLVSNSQNSVRVISWLLDQEKRKWNNRQKTGPVQRSMAPSASQKIQ